MTHISRSNSRFADDALLLVTHMVCADGQIHNEEAAALRNLAKQIKARDSVEEEMEKILAQAEDVIPLDTLAQRIPKKHRDEALSQLLAIAYVDGYCSPLERQLAERVARIWGWDSSVVQQRLTEAGIFGGAGGLLGDDDDEETVSFGARFLQKAESVLSKSLIDKLAQVAPKGVGEKVKQLRREILLSGPEYEEAIARCARVAQDDYKQVSQSSR